MAFASFSFEVCNVLFVFRVLPSYLLFEFKSTYKFSRQNLVVLEKASWPGDQYREISTYQQPISMRYLAYRPVYEFSHITITNILLSILIYWNTRRKSEKIVIVKIFNLRKIVFYILIHSFIRSFVRSFLNWLIDWLINFSLIDWLIDWLIN